MRVQLQGETDIAGFRAEARVLLARQIPPEQIHWSTSAHNDDLFSQATAITAEPVAHNGMAVPRAFLSLCETVVLHSEPQRFALLYRLLWRLTREPALRHDPLDGDMLFAQQMRHAVQRDIHKMRAFLRFREVIAEGAPGGVLHVAWFEPEHHIVEANAPWFMRRFTQMHWAILTPERCVAWNGNSLAFGPGARREAAPPADAGERLWLTYYQNIFNPARLKLAMMQKEMPRKYWRNLPEARFIAPLAAKAMERSAVMIEQPASQPVRRIAKVHFAPRDAPAEAGTLAVLAQAAQRCRDCPIGSTATQAVSGAGPAGAALMLVGEQPGDHEDLTGRPFTGPAGQLLDRALGELGIDRGTLFVTNAVRHFKFELRGKRRIHKTPSQQEASACHHWLEAEIKLVRPGALVALGATAARSLLGRPLAVTTARGQWHTRSDGLRVLVTLHPSALLRLPPDDQPAAFALFLCDLRMALPVHGASGPPSTLAPEAERLFM